MNWRAAIPNALTLGNLACGVLAIAIIILHSSSGSSPGWHVVDTYSAVEFLSSDRFFVLVLLLLAAVFDLLDGWVARMLKVDSALGAQLDSLADLVSFGVVPAIYLLRPLHDTAVNAVSASPYVYDPLMLNLALTMIIAYPLAAAFRLARFNISNSSSNFFIGLPSPASGLLLLGLGLTLAFSPSALGHSLEWITLTILALALAMVSRWPFLSFKGSTRERLALVAVFATGALVAWLTDWQPWVVLATLALYAVVSRVLITPVRRAAQ
jgi:CDP-diacylglycerol--serine O-phosphatidyltransferase